MTAGLLWIDSPLVLGQAVERFGGQLHSGVLGVLDSFAGTVQSAAQATAPWNDVTGAARAGLTAVAGAEGETLLFLVLYHTVEYGIFLELRWGGRFSVINPTLQAHYGALMSELRGLLGG